MIKQSDVREIQIPEDHYKVVKKFAKATEFGGKSSVHLDHEVRMRNLEHNQLTGQIGEYGGCVTLYDYEKYLEKQNQEVGRGQGDGGTDIVGSRLPIDIKTSCVESAESNWGRVLYHRHLTVTKREYSPNAIYVGAVLLDKPSHDHDTETVYVVGWCYGHQMKWDEWVERATGIERSGFKIKYGFLKPLKIVNWNDFLL